jgi:Effector-associated domain 1
MRVGMVLIGDLTVAEARLRGDGLPVLIITGITRLRTEEVRRRLKDAHADAQIRSVFINEWPDPAGELGEETVASAKANNWEDRIAKITNLSLAMVRCVLGETHGKTHLVNAFLFAWPGKVDSDRRAEALRAELEKLTILIVQRYDLYADLAEVFELNERGVRSALAAYRTDKLIKNTGLRECAVRAHDPKDLMARAHDLKDLTDRAHDLKDLTARLDKLKPSRKMGQADMDDTDASSGAAPEESPRRSALGAPEAEHDRPKKRGNLSGVQKVQELTGKDHKELCDALLDAFRSIDEMKQLVRVGIDKNLEALAGSGDLNTIVFRLIEQTESHGLTNKLITAARESRPGNSKLRAFAERWNGPSPA